MGVMAPAKPSAKQKQSMIRSVSCPARNLALKHPDNFLHPCRTFSPLRAAQTAFLRRVWNAKPFCRTLRTAEGRARPHAPSGPRQTTTPTPAVLPMPVPAVPMPVEPPSETVISCKNRSAHWKLGGGQARDESGGTEDRMMPVSRVL